MPYRRLPKTDKARLKAMAMAQHKGDILDIHDLAYSQKLLNEIQSFLPRFENALYEYQQSFNQQVKSNKVYQERLRKARLYVSHYIQAFNMAVLRGELKEIDQEFIGLRPGTKSVPLLNAESSVIEWGNNVVDGEMKRQSLGGLSIYTPSLANVRVHFERFKENYNSQKFLKNKTARSLDNVSLLRQEGDDIILRIWNEVEKKFESVKDEEKRLDLCRDYGVIYYYRKGEQE